jgi:hypothetical protein
MKTQLVHRPGMTSQQSLHEHMPHLETHAWQSDTAANTHTAERAQQNRQAVCKSPLQAAGYPIVMPGVAPIDGTLLLSAVHVPVTQTVWISVHPSH